MDHKPVEAALPSAHAEALVVICDRLSIPDIGWAVTGSTALALRGIAVDELDDIDVQTDSRDWAEAERRLCEYVTSPVRHSEAGRVRSYFGTLSICGVRVEIIGGLQRLGPAGWTEPVDPQAHLIYLDWNERRIPALDLAYEAVAYEELGRLERARQIRACLSAGWK